MWTNKHDVSSPTPAIGALRYVLAIAAMGRRDVASFDLPAQFLQTGMDELLHLKLTGPTALLLVEMDPQRWQKHLRGEDGRPVIYVVCKEAIYGTITAAILAYRKLTGYLHDWGFEPNPYDPCVWNQDIDGKQMTIIFHVDDGLITHVNPVRVTKYLKELSKIYGNTDPIKAKRGKIHEYLGMTLDFTIDGGVWLYMYDPLHKLIGELPDEMGGFKKTAAPGYLFKVVDKLCGPLSKKDADSFHTIVATALYASQRTRPDIQTATSSLCTRVRGPNQHDWKKLAHLMMYIQATIHLPMVIKTEGKATTIYLDGAHAVHSDMAGHGGMFATEAKGAVYSGSNKLKLNTISSTETELVTVGEKLPKILWYRLFRIAQGGYAQGDIILQDNQSTILLGNNGRFSARKGSRHIEIRYFFITDRIQKKHILVKYCPTEDMVADFLSKPLQGAQFHRFRDFILGIVNIDIDLCHKKYIETLKKYDLLPIVTKSRECVEPKTQYGTNPGNPATYSTNGTNSTGPDYKH